MLMFLCTPADGQHMQTLPNLYREFRRENNPAGKELLVTDRTIILINLETQRRPYIVDGVVLSEKHPVRLKLPTKMP